MTLTDVLIAYEGVKERSKLHAMPIVELLLSQLSEKDLAKSRSSGGDTPLKDELRISLLLPHMPMHERLEYQKQIATRTGYVPIPNLSGVTARGILKALEQGLLDKAWHSFGRHYQAIEATARKGT